MQIYGPSQLHGPQGVNAPHARPGARPSQPITTGIGDRLELSEAGQVAAQLAEAAEVRHDRVAEIRQAIAKGTYETSEKLDRALDRLLDEIS